MQSKNKSLLFSPYEHPRLPLRNRVVLAPMGTNLSLPDGNPSEATIGYYAERAEGGAGLLIVEATFIDQTGRHRSRQMGIENDSRIPGLSRLAKAIKDRGAKVAIQISHAGRQTSQRQTGLPTLAPSGIALGEYETPREMTKADIDRMIEAFASSARRAKEAGFDAIEIHGTHGYLLGCFTSPFFNKRTDEYGGSLANRMRFPLEVVRRTRMAVGPDYPIIYRMTAEDILPGGTTPEEGIALAKELVKAGVDFLNVSVGAGSKDFPTSIGTAIAPSTFPKGHLVGYAAAIKASVKAPVIAVGRLNDIDLAEETLKSGKADLIALGRSLIADPFWPALGKSGARQDIRPCLSCNECHGGLRSENQLQCSVNPRVGRETKCPRVESRSANPRRVVCLGGGPAGLEFALTAARMGHDVTLVEQATTLGGQLNLAAIPPGKTEIRDFAAYLIRAVDQAGVRVLLRTAGSPKLISDLHPDVLAVATGAKPIIPPIPGLDRASVTTAWDVLKGVELGPSVIVVGGGYVGLEVAHFLAERGHTVTVLEMLPQMGRDMEGFTRARLLKLLGDRKVNLLANHKVLSYDGSAVSAQDANGTTIHIPGDHVVIAVGSKPNPPAIPDEVLNRVARTLRIGDCVQARKIKDAIREGYDAALDI